MIPDCLRVQTSEHYSTVPLLELGSVVGTFDRRTVRLLVLDGSRLHILLETCDRWTVRLGIPDSPLFDWSGRLVK